MNSLNFDPEYLTNLIERLRLAGFNIGAAQHIRAQNLLILLASRGSLGVSADGLKTWLGPVFCSSPEEQETFYQLFDEWMEEAPPAEPTRSSIRGSFLHGKWLWRSLAAAAVIAVVLIIYNYWWLSSGAVGPQPVASPTIEPKVPDTPVWPFVVGLGLPFLGAGWLIWKLSRSPRLSRWRTNEEPLLERLRVKGVSDRLLHANLPNLRRLKSIVSSDIELNSTVDATARNAGWFTPIYGFRKVRPEYLVMIDRASFGDQQARFGEVFCRRLREDEVTVQHYFFNADPRLCCSDYHVAPHLRLEDIMSLYPEHDLIIFSNGEGLIEPLSGHPAQWLNLLSRQPKRVLLTPLPQHLWGYREHVLAQEGFKVIPANRSGLAELTERSTRGSRHEQKQLRWRPRYPEALNQRPERWLIDEAPAPEDLRKLCFQLRLFLGTEGYQWLCSCAVYPLLLWDLTVYLGERLKYRQSLEENLTKLVQLPWFRYGTMPDWLRLKLVCDLEEDQEHKVRQTLSDLLISSTDGVCDPIVLEILTRRETPQVRRKQGNKLLHDYVKAHPESLLYDYVLLTFMSGRKPDRLTVDVPTEVLDRLHLQGKSEWLIYSLSGVLLAEAYFILFITMFSSITRIFGLVIASCNIIMLFQLNEWGFEKVAHAWRSAMSWLIRKKTNWPDEKHPKDLYSKKKRQAGKVRDRIPKLQNTHPMYTARLYQFAYFSLSACILGLLQSAVLLAAQFIAFDKGFFLKTALSLGLMENALWASAILPLQLKQFRKSLALLVLVILAVVIALAAGQTTILTSLPFTLLDVLLAAAIFTVLAACILQLSLSKISAAIFLIHGYSQWIWRSLWLSSLGTTLIFQLALPAWRILLLVTCVKLILGIRQRLGPSKKDSASAPGLTSLLSPIKVLICSTISDLGPERDAAERAIRSLNLIPIRYETLGSAPRSPKATIMLQAEQCDIFLLIIGERYGYVIESEEVSVVEFEYEIARAQNPRKILVYQKEGVHREPELEKFVRRLQDFEHGYFTSWFTSAEDLQKKIQRDIVNWIVATTGENQLKSD